MCIRCARKERFVGGRQAREGLVCLKTHGLIDLFSVSFVRKLTKQKITT